jgi:hypothetical protein
MAPLLASSLYNAELGSAGTKDTFVPGDRAASPHAKMLSPCCGVFQQEVSTEKLPEFALTQVSFAPRSVAVGY